MFPLLSIASEIHNAASKGDIEGVKKALANGEKVDWTAANPKDKHSDRGTALHWATHENHFNIVNLLIKMGSDVNKTTYPRNMGATPLETSSMASSHV